MAPPPVDSKILFSLIFSLNVHVSIFFFTTMDYINTIPRKPSSKEWQGCRINYHPTSVRIIEIDINVVSFSPVW